MLDSNFFTLHPDKQYLHDRLAPQLAIVNPNHMRLRLKEQHPPSLDRPVSTHVSRYQIGEHWFRQILCAVNPIESLRWTGYSVIVRIPIVHRTMSQSDRSAHGVLTCVELPCNASFRQGKMCLEKSYIESSFILKGGSKGETEFKITRARGKNVLFI
jgi:hypothetical protein